MRVEFVPADELEKRPLLEVQDPDARPKVRKFTRKRA